MIISTITLNPAIDKTYYVNGFNPGGLNRSWKTVTNIGGKGTNISTVARICGYSSIASGFLAGSNGRFIEDTLLSSGVETDFVYTSGETRVNIKIADPEAGSFTDINDYGPTPNEKDLKALFDKVSSIAEKSDIMHFGGSVHPDLNQGIYKDLISAAAAKGAKTVLDTGGEALFEGIRALPSIIKPNQFELEEMLGRKLKTISEIGEAAREIFNTGIKTVLVSLGGDGALGVDETGLYRAYPLNVSVESTVGAGDCFLFGFIHGKVQGLNICEALKFATSFSAAKIQCEGTIFPSFDALCSAKDLVTVEKIG